MSFINDFKNIFGSKGNGLMKIILINVFVFLILNIVIALGNISGLNGDVIAGWLALPSDPALFISQPWTLITYMFLHLELSHVFFNLLWLYWMGRIFSEYLGSQRLVSVYLLGGLVGGLLFFAAFNLIPTLGHSPYLLGASAGVMAVVIAIATIVPNFVVILFLIGPVRLKHIALVSFVLTSVIDLTQNTGGKVAHIGGALFGLLYGFQYKKGIDMVGGMNRFFQRIMTPRPKMKISYKKKISDEEFNLNKVQKQKRIDEILDKISKSGYESLSKEEKEMLFKISNDKK